MELTFASLTIKACARRRDEEGPRSRPLDPILNSRSRMATSPRPYRVNFLSITNPEILTHSTQSWAGGTEPRPHIPMPGAPSIKVLDRSRRLGTSSRQLDTDIDTCNREQYFSGVL